MPVGNRPTGIAVAHDGVWVTLSLDDAVIRLDLGRDRDAVGGLVLERRIGVERLHEQIPTELGEPLGERPVVVVGTNRALSNAAEARAMPQQ